MFWPFFDQEIITIIFIIVIISTIITKILKNGAGATSDAGRGGEDDRPNPSSCHEPHQVRFLIFDI